MVCPVVNDVHSRLSATRVREIVPVDSLETLWATVARARRQGLAVSTAGGRHSMGGQAFVQDGVLLDMRPFSRVLDLDVERGRVTAGAGIQWPALIAQLAQKQAGRAQAWSIAQKQTGADRLTLGGALAANIHGRGLRMRPLVDDVESFLLLDAKGEFRPCSRRDNRELFRLAIGGYGLFGVVAEVTLRLAPRRKLERLVTLERVEDIASAFDQRTEQGCLFGDFQFAIDESSPDFLTRGVFACYRPVDPGTPIPARQRELDEHGWLNLLFLAHTDKTLAFEHYARHYLATSGQVYWSDTHQLAPYLDDYHQRLDRRLGAMPTGSEVIGELFVPRPELAAFLGDAAESLRSTAASLIYGTLRLIEPEDETFLPWARAPWACVVLNLHTPHDAAGVARTTAAFRRLIDAALRHGGSFYLTYGRQATREQLTAAYPDFGSFLERKRELDPAGLFQSEWYRHYAGLAGRHPEAAGARSVRPEPASVPMRLT